ncbi:MAG: NAD-dependent epimerase/dehydratase family protein [Actinomycetes bacterium]
MTATAVVTGGAGFLGSHLCEALLASGHAVVCVDNLSTGRPDNVAHLLDDPRFRLVVADVTEPLPPLPLGADWSVDLVASLASPAAPTDYQTLPIETLRAGALGTEHALQLAAEHSARFLLASTSEVYGDPGVHPQPESYVGHVDCVGPRSMYDEAKRYAEALTTAYRLSHGVDTVIARIFNSYGPRMRQDGRLVPALLDQACAGRPLTIHGDGSQTRCLTYVSDTVAGLLALAGSSAPGPVNIGTDDERSVSEIAEILADVVMPLVGMRPTSVHAPRPAGDPQRRRPDLRLARRLGWQPEVSLLEGLHRTARWWFSNTVPPRLAGVA